MDDELSRSFGTIKITEDRLVKLLRDLEEVSRIKF
jgi:hypothetical protein